MFAPIQNGTIFDMALAVALGMALGICLHILYSQLFNYIGADPLEKGTGIKLLKYICSQAKDFIMEFIGRT